ncbi:universal stress protein [Paenibacillus sp. FSL M8-0228]|jgi:nucleotide-binding universal stress UspA family protein|uniref:universal stress protein n=1 Tax=Paenibacillus TaxID=44249 RepID=UPI00083D5E55|nr:MULTISPECIES: universal stress protein [Paenibacillus]MBO3282896.1 universal stress protein [Paenibacillus polymyxa]MBP1309618.1 nucleotide-binding universal stress UspA family protein [Paenibacillus sp. 1182]ODB57083.1 universal stress protein UspA [Paenibacillus polymyxa]
MNEYKHILVAIDGSEHAMKALETAKTLSKQLQGNPHLTVLHVNPALSMNEPPIGVDVDERIEEEGRHILEPASDYLKNADIPCRMLAGHGNPASIICEIADQEKVDLIIMGTRGKGLVSEMILGSVSHHVIQHAPCPVLTVK